MNKIINWTIGSFFRTIGRIIAYIGIGIVITYILSNSDINWGGITELFFDKVNASALYYDAYSDWYYSNGNRMPDDGTSGYYSETRTSDMHGWWQFYINQDKSAAFVGTQATQTEFIMNLSVLYSGNTSLSYTDNDSNTCQISSTINQVGTDDYEYRYISFTCPSTTSETETYTQQMDVSFYPFVMYGDGNWNKCDLKTCIGGTCTITCHLNDFKSSGITGFGFSVNTNNFNSMSSSYTLRIGIAHPYSLYITTEDLISEQTQQQQQQHEETQNYLEDSNTTEAENEATDFFEDFDAPDIGGLSGIITAPLNTIRSLLNSTCTNLTLPLPFVNQNLTLPCMNTIYTEHFGAFFSIYQTIILALVAYRCIRSIFFDIHGFTNPNDDRIEVMDL